MGLIGVLVALGCLFIGAAIIWWLSERAYIAVDQADVRNAGSVFDIGILMQNVGRTPADEVAGWVAVDLIDESREKNVLRTLRTKSDTVDANSHLIGSIVSGASFLLSVRADFNALVRDRDHGTVAEIQSLIEQKKRALFIYGLVKYQDVFKQPHRRYLCLRLGKTSSGAWTLYQAAENNGPS